MKWVRTDLQELTSCSGTFHLRRVAKQVRHDKNDDEIIFRRFKIIPEKNKLSITELKTS